jgi:hypothetical protein
MQYFTFEDRRLFETLLRTTNRALREGDVCFWKAVSLTFYSAASRTSDQSSVVGFQFHHRAQASRSSSAASEAPSIHALTLFSPVSSSSSWKDYELDYIESLSHLQLAPLVRKTVSPDLSSTLRPHHNLFTTDLSNMARNRSPSPDMMSRNSGSPAPLPQSKRDKRRAMLSERLQDLVSSFSANLRPHYEAQANAIQVDINLVHRADPYQNKPLEDSPDEIANLIRNTVGGKIPADPVAEADFLADAGKLYTTFVHGVNDALEDRDVNLTLLNVSVCCGAGLREAWCH